MRAYLVTNTVNGKQYVGITTKTVAQRWRKHVGDRTRDCGCRALSRALRRYGPEAFTVEHVASARTLEDLKEVERELIQQHGTLAPKGYNLTSGGDGGWRPAEEVREMFRKNAERHRFRPPAERVGVADPPEPRRGTENPFYGRKHSPESLARMSAAKKEKRPSAGTRAKMAVARIGRVFSDETRRKISEAKRGKPHSAETRAKLTEINRRTADEKRGKPGRAHSDETKARLAEKTRDTWVKARAQGHRRPGVQS